ncbi:MAG: HAMP domain-containing histidine kinase [Lachnospiraceae bacterium]|nr:HAMP domain-containing histidine kinase [Lachnospiraceae bacterium]
MKTRKFRLRTILSAQFVLLVIVTVILISIVSGTMISRQFEDYVTNQQKTEAGDLAESIESQYDSENGGWNIDYVHGMGMYALKDGFIIKLYDRAGNILWDAENHDMTLCHEVMNAITVRMQEKQPDLKGNFVSYQYDLKKQGEIVGLLEVSYYTPYFMDENDFQFVTALNRILIAVGAVALIVAVILGILMADRITHPLSKVIHMTRRISNGDYEARIDVDGKTVELSELTDSVNHMAASLCEQENLRKQLTSDVTHELRTPVANISSYMEMMIDEVMEPTPERLQSCYNELNRLSGLISDLERLKNEEMTDIVLEKEKVGLRNLAYTVIKSFESQIREKNIEVKVSGEESFVWADAGRIQQVLANLLSNAVKYTDDGGRILVVIEDHEDSGIVCLQDSGIGIPQADLERIFERFYRTDKSRARKTGGAGIGLSIVKAIVQAHKGTITCESEMGKGSRFIVTLPKKAGES